MSDSIDRQAALEETIRAIKELPSVQQERIQFTDQDHVWINNKQYISLLRFGEAVNAARQERKKGQWIKMSDSDGGYWACSECGKELPRVNICDAGNGLYTGWISLAKTNYCSECGADMRGKTDEVN